MSRLHICNTFFERELEGKSKKSLVEWIRSHPIILQLQFLPLLYAGPDDRILVSDLPDHPDPRLCLLDQPPKEGEIEHWGPSLAIEEWAKKWGFQYKIPPWDEVKQMNSKTFSFTESPKLPNGKLLQTKEEIHAWIQEVPEPKVLKTPFGTAANGHCLNPNVKRLYMPPMIGEPWVERVMDFSTQWKNGELIAVTVFENEPRGTYKGTFEGIVEPWALEEHLAVAKPIIEKIVKMGYSDHVGIDAFIYLWEGKKRVHPIVEINARKTMSWVATRLPEKRLYYTQKAEGLLPSRLGQIEFSRNIICT